MRRRLFLVLALLSLPAAAPVAEATTVVPPPDLAHLARASEAVTFARAVESWVEEGETIPYTVTRFHRLETVTGARTGNVFEVREPGGALPDRAAAVAGAPRFTAGRSYLLFLERAPGSRWRSKMMAYGLLEEVEGAGLLRPLKEAEGIEVRSSAKVEPVGVYRKAALLAHLREVARGARWNRRAVAAAPLAAGDPEKTHARPSSCGFLTHSDGLPMRWFGFETGAATFSVTATLPGQPGIADGGTGAVEQGLGAWTNHPDSAIRYTYGGTEPRSVTCSGNFDHQQGAVLFDDPCEDLADLSNCAGTLAFGGAIFDPNTTQIHDGEPWHPIFSTFVVVNDGAECIGETSFKETLTHELGHTLGFGHHTPPSPADATMSAMLKKDGRGASLAIVDKACASFDYHTFFDVPYGHWAWRWIEAIENAGITSGCGGANYCPGSNITRGQMAVFLLIAREGAGFAPPPCTTPMFADVPCSHSHAAWINELARRGVTGGCGSGNYCPGNPVTRGQMAVFLLATLEGQGWAPPACSTPMFSDVPCSSGFASWVNELVRRGVTAGCGGGNYCPDNAVNRAQMAVFLSTTFGLPVPAVP